VKRLPPTPTDPTGPRPGDRLRPPSCSNPAARDQPPPPGSGHRGRGVFSCAALAPAAAIAAALVDLVVIGRPRPPACCAKPGFRSTGRGRARRGAGRYGRGIHGLDLIVRLRRLIDFWR